MSVEENKELIRRWLGAINARDLDLVDSSLAPDYVGHFGGPEPVRGREGWQRLVGSFIAAFPDGEGTLEDIVAEGDRVMHRETWRGTHLGMFANTPPTGRKVAFQGIAISRIAGGQIVEEWVELDVLGLLQQIGAIPAPA
jgi:steroid delta-isomerase-like uncharacterized protein